MRKLLGMNDTIKVGKKQKISVSEIVDKKGKIFELIKNGMEFDDEVLEKAHIKKTIRNERVYSAFNHEQDKQKYEKDSESLKNILKSLNTLDNQTNETFDTDSEKSVLEV